MPPSLTRRTSLLALVGAAAVAASASAALAAPDGDFGLLVMAHGGGETWNRAVTDMLEPLRKDFRMEIAFGMADAGSLQAAVAKLEARGVRRIGVVRLFISGESWYERTEQILGLRPGAGPRPADHAGHGGHAGHDMALWRIETGSSFALTREGLADAPEIGAVLVRRARALSKDPARESVLILAHGPGDDAENERWLARIAERARAVRQTAAFREVKVATLREDWPEKRAAAETEIRAFVEAASRNGGTAIVIPYRIQGFGPYREVLEGLSYAADGNGLLPSAEVELWVRRQAVALQSGSFRKPV